MGSSFHFLRGFPHYLPHRRFDLASTPQSSQGGTRSGSSPLLSLSVSPANAQGPFLSSWRQSRVTWVSVVIDICGTSKGEAKARACGEGAVQDLGGGWVKPLTLTQVHQHLALTAGTPIGGGYRHIWKEQQKGSGYLLSNCSRPYNTSLSSFSGQTPGEQERNAGVPARKYLPHSPGVYNWVGGRPIKSDYCKNSITALTIY